MTPTKTPQTFPETFTAEQAKALLDQASELFPECGPLTSAQLAGALSLAWQAGYLAARGQPVCDWCDEPVVLTDSGWCHKSDGLYGCGRKPFNTSAQVHGLHRPVAAS
ncbi:MAG: hypothetical protein M0Z88_03975 [Actinomycetota bacterium]|nr:hypothetical protein [Actinomycetota bacterium]